MFVVSMEPSVVLKESAKGVHVALLMQQSVS